MAKDVSPPFLLATHTQSPLSLSKDVIQQPANIFKSHLLHVINGEGDREGALQLLADDESPDALNSDAVYISSGDDDDNGCCYSSEGMNEIHNAYYCPV